MKPSYVISIILFLSIVSLPACSGGTTSQISEQNQIGDSQSEPSNPNQSNIADQHTEGISPCDLSPDQIGTEVIVIGQIGNVDHNDPNGVFADLEDGQCHAGLWIVKPLWDGWGSDIQNLITRGQWVMVSGKLTEFDSLLIVEIETGTPTPIDSQADEDSETTDAGSSESSNFPDMADLPASVQLDLTAAYSGIEGWPALCYLGALGSLVQYENPAIGFDEIVAASGVGGGAKFVDPPDMPAFIFNGFWDASIVSSTQNLGASITAGVKQGGGLADPFITWTPSLNQSNSTVFYFEDEEQALTYLKYTLNQGHPVAVYVDPYYFFDEAAQISENWRTTHAKEHFSHYYAVSGYDQDFIYLHDPTDPTSAADRQPISIQNFMLAWGLTADIPNSPVIGPYWMVYISMAEGQPMQPAEIVAWNVESNMNAPAEIRMFAENMNNSDFTRFSMLEMAKGRFEWSSYLESIGEQQAALLYQESAELLMEMSVSGTINSDDLLHVANLEEQALALLTP